MIFTAVLGVLDDNNHLTGLPTIFLDIYCMQSQIQQILTKIQKYTLWILKELYTMILRHRLIGCLVCNSKEKTLFKFDRY